jgi:hypothetical protein
MDMIYTISRYVETGAGLFTAVVCAVPRDRWALAVIRTRECDSLEGATSWLESLARSLGVELAARGDVLAVGSPVGQK